ncbi:MAG: GTPase [Candidatus Ranarchaeia archaeon]
METPFEDKKYPAHSSIHVKQYNRKSLPKIIFCGQSNVGKSSLINALTRLKVTVGRTPGSTSKIVEYPLDKFVVVDLPGFGFMQRKSKVIREQIKKQIVDYIESQHKTIRLALIIVSLPTFPHMYIRWEQRNMLTIPVEFGKLFSELGVPFIVVANKTDKLSQVQQENNLKLLSKAYLENLPLTAAPPKIFPCSIKKGTGVPRIRQAILGALP